MNNKANIQCNKLMKFDDTMLMYSIYNAETLEKLINIVCKIPNTVMYDSAGCISKSWSCLGVQCCVCV